MRGKDKQCSFCPTIGPLWRSSPPTCQSCARKQATQSAIEKASGEHKHGGLVATEDGKVAKAFYQTKAIKKVSTRQQKLNYEYEKLRVPFLKANQFCQAGLEGCHVLSNQVHHRRGRNEYFLRVDTWMPVCGNCHTWINEHNEAATALGFCQSRLAKTG